MGGRFEENLGSGLGYSDVSIEFIGGVKIKIPDLFGSGSDQGESRISEGTIETVQRNQDLSLLSSTNPASARPAEDLPLLSGTSPASTKPAEDIHTSYIESRVVFQDHNTTLSRELVYLSGTSGLKRRNRVLDALAEHLLENPALAVLVHGYADDEEEDMSHQENAILALSRAVVVQSYLIKECGIEPHRILVDGEFVRDVHGNVTGAKGRSVHSSDDPIESETAFEKFNRFVRFEGIMATNQEETDQ
ncbi:MAG: OmpA family protein [Deltaproteobacteria bacterium]|nr:OmpA family protein [Deltaproteobacteria bacterium]